MAYRSDISGLHNPPDNLPKEALFRNNYPIWVIHRWSFLSQEDDFMGALGSLRRVNP